MAGSSFALWQFGNIKSWNKKEVKVSTVTNQEFKVDRKWFKNIKIYEHQPVKLTVKGKEVIKVEKIKFEEKLDLNIVSSEGSR